MKLLVARGKDYHSSCLLLERECYGGMTPSGPTVDGAARSVESTQ